VRFGSYLSSNFAKVKNFIAIGLCAFVTFKLFLHQIIKMKNRFTLLFLVLVNLCFGQEKFDSDSVRKFQKELNSEYADAVKSPLTIEDRAHFKSFRTENEKPFEMKTSTERKPLYVKYGELFFLLDGKSFHLNVYKNIELSKKKEYKDYLFLPFSDLTSGNESYIGGKYIDLKIPKGNTMAIDFNTSYNPYCAYNPKYSCPIVPLENDLNIEIKAGVKKFHD
jgi:hypothetical protein